MEKPRLKATITEDFKLQWSVPRMLEMVLRGIGAGVDVHVEVKKWYKKRTGKQNATQWGPDLTLIQQYILETTGIWFTKEEIHKKHKKDFLGVKTHPFLPGWEKEKSTTELTTKEMSDFREEYCRYWAEMGLYIPDPKKDDKMS